MAASSSQGTSAIIIDDIMCTGMESILALCPRAAPDDINCNHAEDASVVCSIGKNNYTILNLVQPGK